ncbi:MAG: NAD(P)-dependent oxidoreductase [Planctomycetota bacterium]|jgi:phosphoglycerate dehydrogenase-like enzyme|nr:NAD(P)-dependent oxidoreductase [Planctomycetota bacterium]MDP7129855.1 NAD(P)-dependent oxidoreductase [Planctomycetota bacterium]MDP7249684.1 NAD(P)-dependent oxidoreductase [Planctomycetota bacterium]
MRRLKVLFLTLETFEPVWQKEVFAAVSDQHDLVVFGSTAPIAEQFAGVEAVVDVGGSVGTREMYDAATDARLWQILGTGLDHIDLDYLKTKGFVSAHCPGQFSSVALAETAMMYILMLSHRFLEAAAYFQSETLHKPTGYELESKVLGIIGFGSSGQELARRARAFGMRIQAVDVRPIESPILNELQPEFVGSPDDTDRVISESDFLSLHLHLTPETRHIIDARRLAQMKPSACIINVARGALVDEAALHEALLQGRIGGAGLDVFAQEPPDPTLPVYQLPNVVTTPHTAGATDGTARKRAGAAAENINRVAQGLEPLYRVDQ